MLVETRPGGELRLRILSVIEHHSSTSLIFSDALQNFRRIRLIAVVRQVWILWKMITKDPNEKDRAELQQMMAEELERAYPSYRDYEPPASTATTSDGRIVPLTDQDLKLMQAFSEEFEDELQGQDNRKMAFILDISIYNGETPSQLRKVIDEKGIEASYQVRMAIHLAAKEMGVSYREAAKNVSDHIWGAKNGTRLQ
jgi:hypothetical protein